MKQNKNILKNPGVQSLLTSLLCILLGLFIGYLVLLLINPTGAWGAITNVMKNFLTYSSAKAQLKYLGNTLVRTAPLLMCSLSVLFVYKVGLFNIGAAGQYVAGACACLYAALYLHWHWLPCMLLAIAAGALLGVISGLLKSSFNVSEVISGIMLNWIALYITNMLLTNVKEATSPYTYQLKAEGPQAILPQISLSKLLSGNQYVTIAIPIAIVCAVVIWVVLSKTLFGYELKATGNNPNAAKYCGMAEKRNIEKNAAEPQANEIIRSAAEGQLEGTLSGYGTVTGQNMAVDEVKSDWKYALMPAWTMTYRYKGELYYFAMNGQTGKIAGRVPVSRKKTNRLMWTITAACLVIGALIGGLAI